jgi:predicted DNA-binding transcriptional regulator YafY
MAPNILRVLSRAIREQRAIAIRYYDQRQIRVVEPHAIYTNERGELVVDGFQTRGFSSTGRPTPFWRPFRLKRIASVSLLKESFEPRVAEGFSPDRIKYRSGLVAMIDSRRGRYTYPDHVLQEMGPFLQTRTERLR